MNDMQSYPLDFNFLSLILLIGAVQGLWMGIWILFFKKKRTYASIFLSALLGLMVYLLVRAAVIYAGISQFDFIRFGLLIQGDWAFGPLLYLFVKAYLDSNYQFSWRDARHLIPAMLQVLLDLLDTYNQWLWWQDRERISWYRVWFYEFYAGTEFSAFVSIFLALTYLYFSILLWRESQRQSPSRKTQWFRQLFSGMALLLLCYLFISLFVEFILSSYSAYIYYPFYLILAVFTYWLALKAYRGDAPEVLKAKSQEKPKEMGLDLQQRHQLSLLIEMMQDQKPYQDPQLDLKSLAGKIALPPKQLSRIINQGLDQNFNEFVNQYRVQEARLLLEDPQKQHLNILALGYEAGFNSKASFNRVFRQFTGSSPQEYRQKARKGTQNRI